MEEWEEYTGSGKMIWHTCFKSVRFFLWGYLKSKVYSNRPQSIKQFKDAIRQEITAIPHEMTRWVIDNFRERHRQCVDNNGSHLTDLIFKT